MGFFSDVGNAISSAASAVGDAVESAGKAVADTAEDVVDTVVDTVQDGIGATTEWLCKNTGKVGCAIGNVVGGFLDGVLQGFQEIMNDVFNIVRDVFSIVGSIFSLDLPGLLKDLGELGIDVLDLGVDAVRVATGGYVVGGIVKKFKRSALIRFVDRLVSEEFGDDPDQLAAVRGRIGLEGRRFGLRLPAEHRVFAMDSADVELWRMHEDGKIDLYAMAGLLSFDSFSLGTAHPNAVVKSVDEDGNDSGWPVTRWTISKYLESEGEAKRLRVYAMSRRTTLDRLDTTSRKLDEIGVILEWNDGEPFDGFRDETRQEITKNEYDFGDLYQDELESLLDQPEYDRPPGINCNLLALAGFEFDNFGRAAARDIRECEDFPDNCPTPGRTDECCNTIDRGRSSGVIYRDVYPTYVFKYVLAHEIGHYLGLCHCGHDGFQNVMFRADVNDNGDIGLLSFYWDSEAHFTLEDGKNAWRFIVDQMTPCLTGAEEMSTTRTTRSTLLSTSNSCAVARRPQKREDEGRIPQRVR